MQINIVIKGKCISKDNEKTFNRKTGRPFTSAKYKSYANDVAWQAKQQIDIVLTKDLIVIAEFFMPDKRCCDLTNLPKGCFDALNGIAWVDDKQIKYCTLMLKYDKDNPRVEIKCKEIE